MTHVHEAPSGTIAPQVSRGTRTLGYAALSAATPLEPFEFERREPGPRDVQLEILYCGICHSDLHQVRNEWQSTVFPIVPGHEIVGRVVRVGKEVSKVRPGELVAVGCMVNSCGICPNCREGLEQYCDNELTLTYNSPDRISGGMTYGGYSDQIVVNEHFVLRVSEKLDAAAVAPLLCAGITTYSPLRHWGVGPGSKVGIVGLGGLGHMGVKFAHSFGAEVVLFTTSPNKTADAKRLGADVVVVTRNPEELKRHRNSFDFILDTVAAQHDLDQYLSLLRRDGTLCLVGVPEHPHPSPGVFNLITKRRRLAGSGIGGIRETQEMLDYCAEHGIVSDIETIPVQLVNQAYERMLKGDVKYRFVIDLESIEQERQVS
jgi:uncharacterized zinc-type alcohol dehydrogenase-like protein